MSRLAKINGPPRKRREVRSLLTLTKASLLTLLLLTPLALKPKGVLSILVLTALPLTGTVAKVASLIAIVIGGYGFAHGEPGAKKRSPSAPPRTGIAASRGECPELALERRIAPPQPLRISDLMRESSRQTPPEASQKSSLQEPAQASHILGRRNRRCSTSSASVLWESSMSSIPSLQVSPSSLAALPLAIG